ncbi:MAG: recombinase family protein, partial [Mycobacteriales bacterium]
GFEGRLKQGIYPLPAPRGYLDRGKGIPKSIDPAGGPLVRQAFELYASGAYTYDTLRQELFRRGLRTRMGHALSPHGMSVMLRNPFYIGLIRIKKTNQLFEGAHEPLVSKTLFDRAQTVMGGRLFARPQKHSHTFRRMIRCGTCGYSLVAEIQKGTTYYRCHTRSCAGTSLRECDVDQAMRERLSGYALSDQDVGDIRDLAKEIQAEAVQTAETRTSTLRRDLSKCEERLTRLTDAFLDGTIDQEAFELRKGALLAERLALRTELEDDAKTEPFGDRVLKNLELITRACLGYESATSDEKRQLVRDLTSNLVTRGKTVEITMRNEIEALLKRTPFP